VLCINVVHTYLFLDVDVEDVALNGRHNRFVGHHKKVHIQFPSHFFPSKRPSKTIVHGILIEVGLSSCNTKLLVVDITNKVWL
jgi:hypothetical protein